MVGQQILALLIGVRFPVSEPKKLIFNLYAYAYGKKRACLRPKAKIAFP